MPGGAGHPMWSVSGARLRQVGELDVDDETAALLLKIAGHYRPAVGREDRAKLTLRGRRIPSPGTPLKDFSIPIRTWVGGMMRCPCSSRSIWSVTWGYKVSQATMLRLLRDDGLITAVELSEQRRELKDRKAASTRTNRSGLAAGLQRVRDYPGRDLADRWVPGLNTQRWSTRSARVTDREPVRRDRGDLARPLLPRAMFGHRLSTKVRSMGDR